MRKILIKLAVLFFGIATVTRAANTDVKLLLADGTARPGDTVLAGLHLTMDPLWHTYWQNAGAAGIPTSIKWDLPAGITAGQIQWPVPEKMPPDDVVAYAYDNEVVLLIPLKLSTDLKPGPLELKGKVSWLECKDQCVPGSADVSATLKIGSETTPSPDANLIQSWQTKLPLPGNGLAAHAWWEKPEKPDLRPLVLEWNSATDATQADFYPQASDAFEVQGATERLQSETGKIKLRKLVKKFEGDWPKEISGVLIQKSGNESKAFDVSMAISASGANISAAVGNSGVGDTAATGTSPAAPLWKVLFFGFVGGMILNVMPCVFPVIALKILGFVQQSRSSRKHIFQHGLIYSLGVICSFLVFAGVVIAVRQATGSASWGMQLQNSWFTLVLTAVTLLVALNLFGVFEFTLSGGVMNTAGQLASRDGLTGTFFNGVLAVLLATPCTAPFLAQGVGWAFEASAIVVAAACMSIGLGLAFPYLVLSWQPGWLKFLPKPGAWMEKFKMAMGFPMLATMVWLFSFNARRFGTGGPLRIGFLLVLIGMAAWVWGQFVQRGRTGRGVAMLASLALFVGGAALAFVHDAAGWQKWSPEAVEKARAEGHPVLVDFTADWCLTCQLNKRAAIDVEDVQSKLKQINAVTLIGDNTDQDPAIIAELKKYDRAGVPLVLIYPPGQKEPPMVLPSVLTPGIVLAALDKAAR